MSEIVLNLHLKLVLYRDVYFRMTSNYSIGLNQPLDLRKLSFSISDFEGNFKYNCFSVRSLGSILESYGTKNLILFWDLKE